jgi:hypothetical protein
VREAELLKTGRNWERDQFLMRNPQSQQKKLDMRI